MTPAVLLLWPALALGQGAPASPAQPSAPDTWIPRATAELILLDKMRAQPRQVSVKAGEQTTFGTLTIAVKSCAVRPPDLPQNSAAFLEVTDARGSAPVFRGWVLSGAPAVSQLEHPVYDLRLAGCK